MEDDQGGGQSSYQNENFPLTFTSKIFVGDTVRFEITCPKVNIFLLNHYFACLSQKPRLI